MGITIERKAPERGGRGIEAAPAGQCCCCCCCCLHTVGGVIGALSARSRPAAPPAIPPSTIGGPTREPRHSATGLYWAMTALVSGLVSVYFFGVEHASTNSTEVALLIAICFPGVQLAASVVAALVIAGSRRGGKEVRLAHLGRITLRGFLGAVIGGLLMLPLLGKC
ncbi:MAG TPA: hypothetical protein VFK02_21300 [Kofleriaceae bacterium]|nr:hypothetical protein [Kofleriaceae bacterium]